MEELIKKIEEVRQAMYKLLEEKDILDPEVVALSQFLDDILNEYNNLLKKSYKE
ncbi:aspartyl-phosphate phosphatase Spo0E family protein [Clostridium rectalis]|uniref:aspartyl-phosphate phosphatase Spo0E family protein n=1 Tax=Clostridium rectalis TaxID=2040295 RepID=UPI000F63269A|nr:aspartyl-phosphate phosphatase Spo0E family protein [Clostridium rectalis]